MSNLETSFLFKQNVSYQKANTVQMEKQFVSKCNQIDNIIWEKHMYFIDIETYDSNLKVNWINQVRDPIERFISRYYYHRRVPKRFVNVKNLPPNQLLNQDLNECLTLNEPNCTLDPEYLTEMQLTYFCGSAPECRTLGNKNALQKAKYNAEKYYSVIGVLEELQLSMKLMELYLPKYFQNFANLTETSHKSKEPHKNQLDPDNLRKLENWLNIDIEFYTFVVQRLHNQAKINKL